MLANLTPVPPLHGIIRHHAGSFKCVNSSDVGCARVITARRAVLPSILVKGK